MYFCISVFCCILVFSNKVPLGKHSTLPQMVSTFSGYATVALTLALCKHKYKYRWKYHGETHRYCGTVVCFFRQTQIEIEKYIQIQIQTQMVSSCSHVQLGGWRWRRTTLWWESLKCFFAQQSFLEPLPVCIYTCTTTSTCIFASRNTNYKRFTKKRSHNRLSPG